MKPQISLPMFTLLIAGAQATIVDWYGCSGEHQRTQTTDTGCTNVSGFKTDNLCGVWVPPPGNDHCEFYTTGCGDPFYDTYYCSVSSGRCNAQPWEAINSYRCYPS
jgi:hypothetical protein